MNIVLKADSTTLVLNGTIIKDLAEGDIVTISSVNELTTHQNGTKGNVIIKKRVDSDVHDLVVNVMKFSDSDILLNSWQLQDVPVVVNGSLKEIFIRDGVEAIENFLIENGSLTAQPEHKFNNQDGSAVVAYTFRCRAITRML
jgi:hypothetical protein